jgi:hypothetical protein
MPIPPNRPASRRAWPKWLGTVGWSLLGVLGAILFVYVTTVTLGAVHGTEFCPQTFERRSYSYYELPIVRIQVTGERREDLSGATELFLTSQKYVNVPTSGPQDWHIIVGSRGARQGRKGDASILVQYLDARNSDDYHYWVKWSEDHPELAKQLWPAVQRLAEHQLYVFVPDLFDLAKTIDDPAELKQQLNRTLAEKLLYLANRLDTQKAHAEAAAKLRQQAKSLSDS